MKMNLLKIMSLVFLCCFGLACSSQQGEPRDASKEFDFQELETAVPNDAGHRDVDFSSILEDAGNADDTTASQTRDAGSESDVRPPERDSGVMEQRCDVSDLIYTAEPRDENGPCSDACDSSTIEFVGKVLNPCNHGIEFTTNSTCLVSQWEWARTNSTNASERLSPMCGAAITTHRLDARSSKEQSSRQITGFNAGNWGLTITFSSFSSGNAIAVNPTGEEVSVTFSSQ